MPILYINNLQADLRAGQPIALTRQVNDLNSLDNRQAGYTNKFRLPKTANNMRILQYLTLPGNISAVPYEPTLCSLYSDTGECLVYNGRAVVTDAGDDFEAVVYDGIIDLFKAVENKTLASLDLSALTHEKNYQAIADSWIHSLPYRYVVANFNGDLGDHEADPANGLPAPTLYIDYLVPSISVKYLWDQIFLSHGFAYSGPVFDTPGFTDLWMAYPNGVSSADNDTVVFEGSDIRFFNYKSPIGVTIPWNLFPLQFITIPDNSLAGIHNGIHFEAGQTGRYRIDVEGYLNTNNSPNIVCGKNNMASPQDVQFIPIATPQQPEQEFAHTVFINLQQGDTFFIALQARQADKKFVFESDTTAMTIRITHITADSLDFASALADFPIADFLKEVVHRFGLTIFKDKYASRYEFLTLHEQLEQAPMADWSAKLSKKISENYLYGSYAQQNWFRYNYNDKESNYNDGHIGVPNTNLPLSRDVIKSKLYSPEFLPEPYLGRQANIYKLWERETGSDGTTTYKALDKRYYFMRSQLVNIPVWMNKLNDNTPWSIGFHCAESFRGMPFSDVVNERYIPLRKILERSKIITAELYLTEPDMARFDFRTLYYFEQLGGYYLMNKIHSYVPGRPVKCELVEIRGLLEKRPVPPLRITRIAVAGLGITVHFELNVQVPEVTLMVQPLWETTWHTTTYGSGVNPRSHAFPGIGTYLVKLAAEEIETPVVEVTINDSSYILDF